MTNSHNVLQALGVVSDEDTMSNLLRYCFDESTEFREVILRDLSGLTPSAYVHTASAARVKTPVGVPDLAFAGRRADGTSDLVLLENKLNAREGPGQITRYGSPACAAQVARVMGLASYNEPHRLGCLALCDYQRPFGECRFFTYPQLLDALRIPDVTDHSVAALLLRSLPQVLERFYRQATPGADQLLLNELQSRGIVDGLDTRHAYFIAAFDNLDLPPGVRRGDSGVTEASWGDLSWIQYTKHHQRAAA